MTTQTLIDEAFWMPARRGFAAMGRLDSLAQRVLFGDDGEVLYGAW